MEDGVGKRRKCLAIFLLLGEVILLFIYQRTKKLLFMEDVMGRMLF